MNDKIQGSLFARATATWNTETSRRLKARSPQAADAVRAANKAHLSAQRDLRRDRHLFEKARSEVAWWNVFNGERRAARSVVRDSAMLVREARNARREARRSYPLTMPALATRCHAAHFVPTAAWATVSDSVASSATFATSVAAVAATLAVAWNARRTSSATPATPGASQDALAPSQDALTPSQDETDLLRLLEPATWTGVAEPRGLTGVVSAGATLTESGIQARLMLDGTMTLSKLRGMEAQLRAALRLGEGVRLELREGKTGGHARLTLRTRSAADGVDLTGWQPGAAWGVDTVTGEAVPVPLGRRMLITGTSGSGKSYSARPILAEASEADDHRLVVLDMKRVEARLWRKRARIAITPEEILAVLEELVAEMYDRLDRIPDGEDVVRITSTTPRITVFVDEGSELMAASKKDYAGILEHLRTLARMGRAAEIVLVWATQKPLLSGDSPGLDTQVAGQVTCRLSLAVSTQKESMTVFGDDAIAEGWEAHKLPMPGVAMLRDSNTAQPHHIRMRAISPKEVMALPERPVWSRRVSSTGATQADIDARMSFEKDVPIADPWVGTDVLAGATVVMAKPRVSAEDRDDQLLNELRAKPCRSMGSLASAVGASKSVVKRSLERMAADGLVECREDKCWYPLG